ncbi:MAG: hypothetical protein CMI69_02690 [Candidatus Pelagibacter sp.]|jgi:ABC-type dipeptide/oligopeptide/nickel transport system permease subunit|nr:hypothetical protein [Candidatus Pelagibacter sp.]
MMKRKKKKKKKKEEKKPKYFIIFELILYSFGTIGFTIFFLFNLLDILAGIVDEVFSRNTWIIIMIVTFVLIIFIANEVLTKIKKLRTRDYIKN